jgi:hypothetical protein
MQAQQAASRAASPAILRSSQEENSITAQDHEAYKLESPLPAEERLYLGYVRNRKKADLRRGHDAEDENRAMI